MRYTMNNKKPNRQQVNKVRRKADEQDITLGSRSSLPEDEVKSLRKKGSQLEIKHTRKPTQGEQEPIRTGRAPKKEKKPYDRHAPRKSELEKEFTHELQKIRNRLNYRKKQGFFVDFDTLPARPSRVTRQSIEKLKQYQVQLNDLGEIVLKRVAYGEQARELRIRKQDLPNYDINNEPNFVPPMESVQNFDVFDRIEQALLRDISIVSDNGIDAGHPLEESRWVILSSAVEEAYREALDLFRATRDSHRRQEYADYLMAHEEKIIEAIDVLLYVSDQEQLLEAKDEMLMWLQLH